MSMQSGCKLSISIQGKTGTGRTYSALRLCNGARKILFPEGKIIYINLREGHQIDFYKKEFTNLEIFNYDNDFAPSQIIDLIKNLVLRDDVFAIIADTYTALWKRICDIAGTNFMPKKGDKNDTSSWAKWRPFHDTWIELFTKSGPMWVIGILLEKNGKAVLIDQNEKTIIRKIGNVEVGSWDVCSRFDINIRTLSLTGRAKRRFESEKEIIQYTDTEINPNAMGEEHFSAGFFKTLKRKGPITIPFPLDKYAPVGMSSDREINESIGEELANWRKNF